MVCLSRCLASCRRLSLTLQRLARTTAPFTALHSGFADMLCPAVSPSLHHLRLLNSNRNSLSQFLFGWVVFFWGGSPREEHSMDQYRSRPKLFTNFQDHWSIPISGEIHMDQSLVHSFSWGNSYGPMVLKILLKFPPKLVLVHGWLFPVSPS